MGYHRRWKNITYIFQEITFGNNHLFHKYGITVNAINSEAEIDPLPENFNMKLYKLYSYRKLCRNLCMINSASMDINHRNADIGGRHKKQEIKIIDSIKDKNF